MTREEKLIGKKVYITDKESWFFGEWGIIQEAYGGEYVVAIANGSDSMPILERWQFRLPRKKGGSK